VILDTLFEPEASPLPTISHAAPTLSTGFSIFGSAIVITTDPVVILEMV
jgi:hypothetical protein